MKKYEAVAVEIIMLGCGDIISTSGDLPFDSEPDYL